MSENPQRSDGAPALQGPHGATLWLLTGLTLIAFAGNSLFCRAALAEPHIDPVSFTFVRLVSGAAMLGLLLTLRGAKRDPAAGGGWRGGAYLVVYAILFSLAYRWIPAGVGALVLFALVQLTMLTAAVRQGTGPRGVAWVGVALALGGLANLTLPGADAPDLRGLLLMAGSGVFWGLYSLVGAKSRRPVLANARNFNRAAVIALPLAILPLLLGPTRADAFGLTMAVASGALASGLGYVLWYTVLPSLGATRGSVLQLAVPVIAAFGGLLWLGEPASAQLIVSSAAILGGIAVVLATKARPAR